MTTSTHSLQILEYRYVAKHRLLKALQAIQDCRKQIPTLFAPIHTSQRKAEVLKHFQAQLKSHNLDNTIVRFSNNTLFNLIEIHTTFQNQNETAFLWLDDPRDHHDIRSSERKTDKQIILALASLGRRIQSEQAHTKPTPTSILRKQFARMSGE